MDLFFKCINTKLVSNVYMSNSDEMPYNENIEFKKELDKAVVDYIKEINNII